MIRAESRSLFLAALALVVVTTAAYFNSFSVPFLFDDLPSIVANPTIRRFADALHPPPNGATVAGRPLLNFSFALNYAIGGTRVTSYHVFNLAIHVLAALTLFGVVRRTLLLPLFHDRFTPGATRLALSVALLWSVHPLQTESVTFLSQRAESLAALFYLLTLYAFLRSATCHPMDDKPGWAAEGKWAVFAWTSALAGMATKETVVTAPLLVLLYDRTFLAGTFRDAWRLRGRRHLALASTWLLLLAFVANHRADRGGTAGFDAGITWWQYGLTQCGAILHYARVALWPHPLIFDYGFPLAHGFAGTVLPLAGLLLLIGAVLLALRRRPVLGFLGCWFLVILAPSSSIVPIASQTIAEHRVYLPLAALTCGLVLWLHALVPRWTTLATSSLVLACAAVTFSRNTDYRTPLALWTDTVAKRPSNPRAHFNLGLLLESAGDKAGAESHYRAAVQLDTRNLEVHLALGELLLGQGKSAEARAAFEDAITRAPGSARAQFGLANVLAQSGDTAAAIAGYRHALELDPGYAPAHANLGTALLLTGRADEAVQPYEAAVRIDPSAPAHTHLANALAQTGKPAAAIAEYETALRLNPNLADAHYNLGELLVTERRGAEAVPHFEKVLQLEPANPAVQQKLAALRGEAPPALPPGGATAISADDHYHLANRLASQRPAEAIAHYREALRLNPGHAAAHTDLGKLLAESDRIPEATSHFEAAVRLSPANAAAHANLGNAYFYLNRVAEARAHYLEALRLDPNNSVAREMLPQLPVEKK